MKSTNRRLLLVAGLSLLAFTANARADWNSTIASSNPLNWYQLNELSGSTAFDHGSEGLNGTYGVGVNAPTRGVAGLVGTAVSFDGDRKNIVLGGSDLTGDWSAEFIVEKTGSKFSAELLRGVPLAFPSSHLKLEQYPNTQQVGYTESFVADRVFSPPFVAPIGKFIDLVYVKTSSQMTLYVNGILSGTNGSTIPLARYEFGDTESESPIAVVDEIVIYNRALSAPEIGDHFNSIPEPSSFILAALGVIGLIAWRRRRG
jgi:hypothetical protein